ncbi:MAG: two-component system response regulator [Proteobacteria bacterium]|nr:two-component system response regulator [Pseudomonadota bacterium]
MVDLSNSIILVVDDIEENIDILVATLEDSYDIVVATEGSSAVKLAHKEIPDLILLDILMPGMDGYEVCRLLKEESATRDIPVIFFTGLGQIENKTKAFEMGAVDYITKPFQIPEVRARVKTHLLLKKSQEMLQQQNIKLEEKVKERTQDLLTTQKDLELTQDVTINCMASLAETRDPETGGHIMRTQNYVKALAKQIRNHPRFASQLNDDMIDNLFKTAPLHDIGKVGVPDHILLKPGKLTVEEFEEMKKHTIYGKAALNSSGVSLGSNSFLTSAEKITMTHHEKWDGSGYPNGLKEDGISLSGRLMALADVYDALISRRVYKPPFPHKKAVEIIANGKGSHFDPDLVEAFLAVEEEFRQIGIKFTDSEEERSMLMES